MKFSKKIGIVFGIIGLLLDVLLFVLILWISVRLIVTPDYFSVEDLQEIGVLLIVCYLLGVIPSLVRYFKKCK